MILRVVILLSGMYDFIHFHSVYFSRHLKNKQTVVCLFCGWQLHAIKTRLELEFGLIRLAITVCVPYIAPFDYTARMWQTADRNMLSICHGLGVVLLQLTNLAVSGANPLVFPGCPNTPKIL